MGELYGVDAGLIVMANVLLSLILLLFIIILFVKLNTMKTKHKKLLNGESNVDIEQLLIRIQERVSGQEAQVQLTAKEVETIKEALKKMKSKVGLHRYNAFGEGGSDLSFTLAILDEYQDGVLLTGIHSREQTYIYAKPVQRAESKYTLSPEEKETIILMAKQQL
ncbi:hypothetical protein D3C73_414150 [compost metagenome]